MSNFIQKRNIDILMINETKLKKTDNITIPRYKIYNKNRPIDANDRDDHAASRVAIIIKENIPHKKVSTPVNIQQEAITNQLNNKTHITAIYNKPLLKITAQDLDRLTSRNEVLLVGDFNARHTTWDVNKNNNTNGNRLHKYVTQQNVVSLSPPTATHFPPNGMTPSTIDLVINKNVQQVSDPTTITDLPSDHDPVIFKIGNQEVNDMTRKIVTYKNTDWKRFKKVLDDGIIINNKILTTEELEQEVIKLTNAIQWAQKNNTKTITVKVQHDELPQDIIDKIQQRNALRRIFSEQKQAETSNK